MFSLLLDRLRVPSGASEELAYRATHALPLRISGA
jgi:hypothetical protein